MNYRIAQSAPAVFALFLISGCGGGSSAETPAPPPAATTGTISVSITDDPWHDAESVVLHITAMEFHHSDGTVFPADMPGGPMDVDMMQLQNGVAHGLIGDHELPAGQYNGMQLQVDLDRSYIDRRDTGGRHGMRMGPGAGDGLEVQQQFRVEPGQHVEFMLDFDLRSGLQHRHGGMMGDQFELHDAMRLIRMDHAGGLVGNVDPALIDVNHPDCDPADGGNWMYVFPGDAEAPDDIADVESDGVPGPIATDRVEMNPGTGAHEYHFGYLPEGTYRVAFTCSGEWDESGDDDYPSDPDGEFDFQHFSGPVEITAGQVHRHDL
jgi:hypothetical protein